MELRRERWGRVSRVATGMRAGLAVRSSLLAVLIGFAATTGACDRPVARSERPRNLILISLDTLRADRLGCYGHGRNTSPTIDALAAAGVRFADASAAAPWTLPSHATLFTGLYPSRHGVKDQDHRLADERVTLAERLATQGFQTFAVVNSWNLGEPRFAMMQGFDDVRYLPESRGEHVVDRGREIVDTALEMLGRRDPARPFFLFVHFYDAHSDYAPEPAYRKRFVGPYAGNLDGSTHQLVEVRRTGRVLSEADLAFLGELYDAEIRQLDDQLARLFAGLEAGGRLQDSLIVLTSDHGEEFQEHGGVLHGRTQYQEMLAVPLIFRGPGIPRGRVVREPVSLVDVAPTILALLGLPAAGVVDGIDLSPSWASPPEPLGDRFLFAEASQNELVPGPTILDRWQMVRHGSEKLCTDRIGGRAELYDLAADPAERVDRSATQPETMKTLAAALAAHRADDVTARSPRLPLGREELERLRVLGYVDEEPEGAGHPR